jgi:hypothetical protein
MKLALENTKDMFNDIVLDIEEFIWVWACGL